LMAVVNQLVQSESQAAPAGASADAKP
jgi:hypothetical protein